MPTSMDRRTFLKATGLAGLTLASASALSACGGSGGSGGDKGTLKVWQTASFTKAGDKELQDQAEAWGKDNGYAIEYTAVPGSDYTTKVTAAVEANALPDVVMLQATQPIFFGSQGHLADLTDIYGPIKGQGGGLFKELEPYYVVGDKTWAIPMESDVNTLYALLPVCEKALGEKRAPKTLAECEKVARAAVKDGMAGFAIPLGNTADANGFRTLIFSNGGTLVDAQGKPAINNPGTIETLETLQRWWKDKLIPGSAPGADDAWNNQQFLGGKCALTMNPPSVLGAIQKDNPKMLPDITQGALPAGSKGSVQYGSCWSWGVSAKSQHIDASKQLITYLMDPARIQTMYEKVGGRWFPVYQDLPKEKFWADQQAYYKDFPQMLKDSKPDWAPATASATLLTQLQAVMDQYVPSKMLQNVLLRNQTPAAAAKAAQTQMEQIFTQYAKAGAASPSPTK